MTVEALRSGASPPVSESASSGPAAKGRPNNRALKIAFCLTFLFALVLRIPFYATHHIQEDAYITFRAAFHLADAGDYSFNLGEHASGVTSAAYGPYVAAMRVLFGSQAINAVSVMNTVIFLLGAVGLSFSFFDGWRQRLIFFLAIATLPMALLITYTDMEIPLQAALVGWTIFTMRSGQPSFGTYAGVLLLPLIRPDAIAYSLILSVLALSFDRVRGAIAVVSSFAGEALVLIFNRITSGHFIPDTARAKEITYHPDHHLLTILATAKEIWFGRAHSYLSPVGSALFARFNLPIALITIAGGILAIWLARDESVKVRLLIATFAAGTLIPAAYAVGGVIFPWYLWTNNWLCEALLCYVLVRLLSRSSSPAVYRSAAVALVLVWLGLIGFQWLVSYNKGLQEYHYRADIGRYLAQISHPDESLLLEPAGYIPFFAKLRTYDEVGLVSPLVLTYRQRYGGNWWIEFLKQRSPVYLVERDYVLSHTTMDHVTLSAEDARWFDQHYSMIKHFHYSPNSYLHQGWLLKLMENGSHDDYWVYQRNQQP
jgi:hypothetical protein